MIVWDILNSLARVVLAVLLVWHLWRYDKLLSALERTGLSMSAGTSLLTVTVIFAGERSPFDGWATTLFSLGFLLYAAGRHIRVRDDHTRNNELQIAQGRLRWTKNP